MLVSFAILLPYPPEERVEIAMKIYCSDNAPGEISKTDFTRLLKIMNTSFSFFGDKSLHVSQVDDLVDSVYTLRGKIDGDISRHDAITLMFQHPIVELALSIQFQGSHIWK